jgi:hypothetical protein
MLVEFVHTAIGRLLGTAQVSCCRTHASLLIDMSNNAISLSNPDRQFSIMQFREEHLFLTTPKPSYLNPFWHRYAPSSGA